MTRFAVLPLALSAALAAGCSGRAEKAALPPVGAAARAVRTIRPAATVETGLARATGTIRAREDAVLSAKATGQIKRIRVQVGDRVRAGAPLAEMDATNAQIALENARALERLAAARLAEAEREVARCKSALRGRGDAAVHLRAGADRARRGRGPARPGARRPAGGRAEGRRRHHHRPLRGRRHRRSSATPATP